MDEATFINELADEMTTAGRPATAGKLRAAAALLTASRPADGIAKAWMVYCPKGHEYDYMVLHDETDAEVCAEGFNEQYPEGESPHEVIPLYDISPAAESEKGGQHG